MSAATASGSATPRAASVQRDEMVEAVGGANPETAEPAADQEQAEGLLRKPLGL